MVHLGPVRLAQCGLARPRASQGNAFVDDDKIVREERPRRQQNDLSRWTAVDRRLNCGRRVRFTVAERGGIEPGASCAPRRNAAYGHSTRVPNRASVGREQTANRIQRFVVIGSCGGGEPRHCCEQSSCENAGNLPNRRSAPAPTRAPIRAGVPLVPRPRAGEFFQLSAHARLEISWLRTRVAPRRIAVALAKAGLTPLEDCRKRAVSAAMRRNKIQRNSKPRNHVLSRKL